MDINQELITRFFKGQCTPAEADEVAAFLAVHPEVQDEYLTQQEWKEAQKEEHELSAEASAEIWMEIDKETRPVRIVRLQWMAVAAVISGIFFMAYLFIAHHKNDQTGTLAKIEKPVTIPEMQVSNRSVMDTVLHLPDGSTVILAAGSNLSYRIDKTLMSRILHLTGKATFQVAKDKTRPFTVYSRDISTTALGTRFLVSTLTDGQVEVKLYEGKIVVKTGLENKNLTKAYYLLPGNRLLYDERLQYARLLLFDLDKKIKHQASWFMFNNESLAETLDQLAAIYGKPIIYDKQELNGTSFIGQISKSDSLQSILTDISSLNNLQVTRQGKGYQIRKK